MGPRAPRTEERFGQVRAPLQLPTPEQLQIVPNTLVSFVPLGAPLIFCGNRSWCRSRANITRVPGDVAGSTRKDIPSRSARYAFSAEVLIATWRSLSLDPTSWTQRGGRSIESFWPRIDISGLPPTFSAPVGISQRCYIRPSNLLI
jgi:hypothetical protein